jgi:hypothetical protein
MRKRISNNSLSVGASTMMKKGKEANSVIVPTDHVALTTGKSYYGQTIKRGQASGITMSKVLSILVPRLEDV